MRTTQLGWPRRAADPEFIAATSNQGVSLTTLSNVRPVGTLPGDLLVAYQMQIELVDATQPSAPTPPGGLVWTLAGSLPIPGDFLLMTVFTATAGAEAGPYDFTVVLADTSVDRWGLMAYRNVTPGDFQSDDGLDAGAIIPSVTLATPGMVAQFIDTGNATIGTPQAGYSFAFTLNNSAGIYNDAVLPAGPTGTQQMVGAPLQFWRAIALGLDS